MEVVFKQRYSDLINSSDKGMSTYACLTDEKKKVAGN